jgi:hypothetical protein
MNSITNDGAGIARLVLIESTIGNFVSLELTDLSGEWTALNFLTPGFTVTTDTE